MIIARLLFESSGMLFVYLAWKCKTLLNARLWWFTLQSRGPKIMNNCTCWGDQRDQRTKSCTIVHVGGTMLRRWCNKQTTLFLFCIHDFDDGDDDEGGVVGDDYCDKLTNPSVLFRIHHQRASSNAWGRKQNGPTVIITWLLVFHVLGYNLEAGYEDWEN